MGKFILGGGYVSFTELLKQLSILIPHDTHLINPPSWYVPVEVRLFIVIPFIVMLSSNFKNGWLLFLFGGLSSFFGSSFYGTCFCGCLIRIIYENFKDNRLFRSFFSNIVTAVFALTLLNINNYVHIENNCTFGIQSFAASVLVLNLWINKTVLANKLLVSFGNISYEFYLIHFIVLLLMKVFYYDIYSYIIISFLLSLLLAKAMNYICAITITRFKYNLNAVG